MTSELIDTSDGAYSARRRSIWGITMAQALAGKVAVICGSASGIGAGTATLFVAEGVAVVIAGRRHDKGERRSGVPGQAAGFIRTNIAVEADVEAMIGHALAAFGRAECLVNNVRPGSDTGGEHAETGPGVAGRL